MVHFLVLERVRSVRAVRVVLAPRDLLHGVQYSAVTVEEGTFSSRTVPNVVLGPDCVNHPPRSNPRKKHVSQLPDRGTSTHNVFLD